MAHPAEQRQLTQVSSDRSDQGIQPGSTLGEAGGDPALGVGHLVTPGNLASRAALRVVRDETAIWTTEGRIDFSSCSGKDIFKAYRSGIMVPVESASGLVVASPDAMPDSAQKVVDRYMELRTGFMRAMRWREYDHTIPPEQADRDLYDALSATQWFIKTDNSDASTDPRVLCGMRLTTIGSLEESLTFNMLSKRIQGQIPKEKIEMINAKAEKGEVRDLTRLVLELGDTNAFRAAVAAFPELYGAAMADMYRKGTDVIWFYLTTKTFHEHLVRNGVGPHEVLWSGMVSATDDEESYLCWVDTAQRDVGTLVAGSPKYDRTRRAVYAGIVANAG